MNDRQCPCVFPQATEVEVITVEGPTPSTAFRLHMESTSPDGYIRLEQMVHEPELGWFVQKSLVVPVEVLRALLPHLKKADCLIPRARTRCDGDPIRLFGPSVRPQTRAG